MVQDRRLMHRRVTRLAAPVVLSNISVPMLGMVDTAVMGHLPDPAYLGGIAVGALIFSYIYWGFGFLRMGTTGLVAQAHGAGDADGVRAVLARSLLLAWILAAVVLALQAPIAGLAFAVLEASARVEALAGSYYAIRIWGAPAQLMYYAVLGTFFGTQRMAWALALTLTLNGINIVLDIVFVVALGWGIEGVAAATIIAEWSTVAIGAVILSGVMRRLGGAWSRGRIIDRERILALLRVNGDIFVRTLCLISAFAYFTAKGAELGDVTLAANAVLMNFTMFSAYALDAFAHAAEALVGSAYGARDRSTLRGAVVVSTQWALGTAALLTMAFVVLGHEIVALLTDISTVRETAGRYLLWPALLPLVAVWSFQLDGIFIGATRTPEMRNGMILSLAVFLIAQALLLPRLGNHGLWLALVLFMVARAATLAVWYPRIERATALRPSAA